MMNKNYYLPATVCALAVCLALCFAVAAWNSPTETPPAGNVAAPINTGGEAQYKTGGLGVKIGGAVTYWISQIGDKLAFKTGNDFATAVETVNINTDGRIGNVAAPIDDKDAVNKAYLDAQSGGGANYGTCTGGFLDIKFTAATYNPNLGGIAGADGKCAAEYPGYHFCQDSEVKNFGKKGCLPISGQYWEGAGWIDSAAADNCMDWTRSDIVSYSLSSLIARGSWYLDIRGDACNNLISALACCKEI